MADEPTNPTGFPDVTDDAADSPMWLPGLGIGLFVLVALYMVLARTTDDTTDQALQVEQVEAAAAEGEAAQPDDGAPIEFKIVEDDAH